MTALAQPASAIESPPVERIMEALARIDRGGLSIPEAELRHTLCWDDALEGELLDLLAELEARGLIESAIHFRLTDAGREQLPASYEPRRRYGRGMSWEVER
jgi:hypothetical protein